MMNGGAVSYLAHSKYGTNGKRIQANTSSAFITGNGGIKSTTTGNYYGVYDMAGGAYDAVSAAHESKKTEIDEAIGSSNSVDNYFNIYSKYENNNKGDAIFETSLRQYVTTSWFSGFSWLVDATEPYMTRGGCSQMGTDTSNVFSFHRYKTVFYHLNRVSFRPTITMEYLY